MLDRPGKPATDRAMQRSLRRLNGLLNKYWRVGGTAISFTAFGVGGLVLRLMVFPLLNLIVRNEQSRTVWARCIIRLAFRAFVELMSALGVLSYRISGRERLQRNGLLILANHPSLIDTVLLMAFVKQADCIVKSALWRNPFTRGPVRAAGYISNAHGPELVADCINSMRSGGNLIIFPEGTRTPADGNMSFKRGAANVAVRGACAITPVIIRCTQGTLGKGNKWWKVPATMAHFDIEIQQDIEIRDIPEVTGDAGNPSLAARQLTYYLQNYFMKES
jgi:1-acyl-sn-glycerol-3-phosphate acyltransferase